MLEFRGEVSFRCKKYLLKRNAIVAFFSVLMPIIFLSIGFIIVYVLIDAFALWMLVLCEVYLLLLLILAFLSPYIYRKKTLARMLPKVTRVNEEGVIDSEFETFSIHKTIDDIKRIIDFGEWYYIIFKFPKSGNLICQKSLLVEGSIDDFNNMFSDKIIQS